MFDSTVERRQCQGEFLEKRPNLRPSYCRKAPDPESVTGLRPGGTAPVTMTPTLLLSEQMTSTAGPPLVGGHAAARKP
jgi:hypothetical protein